MGRFQRLGICTIWCSITLANLAVAGSPASSDTPEALNEVVVTAQRREEQIMNVPISVTALSGENLQNMGATSFADYAGSVAGLSYTYIGPLGYRGVRNYALRGITGSNTVGFYIDEAPVPILDPKLIDVDRIEVLRGPQATLYGSNSVGGTIKLVTVQPDAKSFSGRVESDVSSTAGSDRANSLFAGVINVPLLDDVLAARISASRTSNGGFIDNYYDPYPGLADSSVPPYGRVNHGVDRGSNNEVAETARIALRYTPNQRLTVAASFMYNNDQIDSNDYYFPNLPLFSIQHFIPTPEGERFTLGNVTATYEMGPFELVNATTYFRRFYSGGQDVTQIFPIAGYETPTPILFTSTGGDRIFTEEMRVQSHSDGPLNGALGAIYTRNSITGTQSGPIPGLSAFNPTLPAVPDDNLFLGSFPQTNTEKDVYAEIRYKVIPRLELIAGGRYYNIHIKSSQVSSGLFGGGDFTGAEETEHGFRPRGTVSWQATDDLLLFANYAKGFRPGGINPPLPSICTDAGQYQGGGLESDTVSSYDVGSKLALFNHRMDLTVSAYRMKWSDIQQHVTLPCGVGVDTNTGNATSRGLELEGRARVIAALTLDFEVTYAYTNLDTAQPGNFALAGDPILNIPRWKAGIGAQYDVSLTQRWGGFSRIDYDYQGSADLNYGNRPDVDPLVRPSYGTLGMHLGVQDDHWRLELYGSNLTNEHPVTNSYTFATPAGTPLYSTIRPRTVGANAVYKF